MSVKFLLGSALVFITINGRSFNHTQVSTAPSNGTGLTLPPNGTIYSTPLPPTNSTPCPFLNGTIIYANGTHFLVASSAPIGKAYDNSSGCPPINGNSTTSPLNGTVLTTPSPFVNSSQPFAPNSTYAPFTNGTFGIYGNGTHFWLAPSVLKSNFSHQTYPPLQNVTIIPGNFTQSPGNYTQYPSTFNVTATPLLNVTSYPSNNTIYSTLPPGNWMTSPPSNFSLGGSLIQNAISSQQKKEQPVVINIILGQN